MPPCSFCSSVQGRIVAPTPNGQGEFDHAPYLNFNRDNRQVNLNANEVGNPNSNYGSGSLQQFTRMIELSQ